VAKLSIASDSQKHSEKIFKSEIFCKVCEITFVSLNCLR